MTIPLRILLLSVALALLAVDAAPLEASDAVEEPNSIMSCVNRMVSQKPANQTPREATWDAASLCQTLVAAEHTNRLERIRADNYLFQRTENTVLMYMVVAITLAGVLLAAAQLWASFILALKRGGGLSDGSTIDLSKDKIAIQSSVVGVVVLGISLAFFSIFVLWVYTLDEPSSSRSTPQVSEPPHQISSEPPRSGINGTQPK
ncbi:hypothetical protein [Bradyrhizobium sp. Arg816]|uniref:hypothetical protein n=1 Tax=Bradyrhizobium sp. Arg816 TaxID=2998491 RepID=UPI00249EB079|nr:hypothetical protein [Bradyrhizobium sp. Arg816]MDI3561733.1 hypothetical protein [Bradyrhizobium sp. Arg816]